MGNTSQTSTESQPKKEEGNAQRTAQVYEEVVRLLSTVGICEVIEDVVTEHVFLPSSSSAAKINFLSVSSVQESTVQLVAI